MYVYICACIILSTPQISAVGAAEKDGRLRIGQRILEVNGTSLLGATHLIAVRALRNNPMEVSLLICDGYDPREVMRRKMEQEKLSASNVSATMDTSSLSSEGKSTCSCTCNIYDECIYIPVILTLPTNSFSHPPSYMYLCKWSLKHMYFT